jgi:eukaryotic-like serine/threonine-protein kinase
VTPDRLSSDPGALQPGTRIGHYAIVEKLGEGGEAIVYRARDLTLDRDVALKTPRAELASAAERAHLMREARTASRLSHPAIVPIHEVFEDLGRPWFAMGLVEGSTLRAILAQRVALPVEDVVRYGEMLADALRAAHAKHVLHRDVTPANVFVTPDGRLLLADFGMAFAPEAPDATTQATVGHRAAGTIGYMSPEQMMGRDIGPQSDVFSAGVVMYQMATGNRPFEGRTLGEVLDSTLNRPIAPIPSGRDIPEDLEHVIRKALARRLDERYTSAEEMFVDLRALRRRLESGGSGPLFEAPRPRSRARTAAAAAAAVAAILALAAAGAWAWLRLQEPPLPQAVPLQVTTGSGWEAGARISPVGTDIAYVAEGDDGNIDVWLVDARGGTPIRLTDDAARDRSPAWFPDGSAIAFVSDRSGTPGVWKVPRLGGQSATPIVANADEPAISPDGTRIAFTRPDAAGTRRIVVAPLADPAAAKMLTTDADGLWTHESPAWSPDGSTICYAAHTDLWVVPASGGKPGRLTKDGEADFEPAYSSDGRWVYFASMRGETTAIWRVPAAGGTPERVTMGSGPESEPSLSSDGARLTYSTFSLNSDIVVRSQKTGAEYRFGSERRELYPSFSPDGSAVVFVSEYVKSPPDLWIQSLAPDGRASGPPRRLTDHPGTVAYPSWSPDGRWIAYHRALEGQRDVWIVPAEGGVPARFTDDPAVDTHPAWSPDGTRIAFVSTRGGGISHIWLAPVAGGAPAGPAHEVTTGPLSHDQPAWSPDSSMLAFIATDAAGSGDVWVTRADAAEPGRRVTQGAAAEVVAWTNVPGQLVVSGTWKTGRRRLALVDVATGRAVPTGPDDPFGSQSDAGDFALSRDGRFLAFARQSAKGDIWVLVASRGRY